MNYHVTDNKRIVTDEDIVLRGEGTRKSIAKYPSYEDRSNGKLKLAGRLIPCEKEAGHFIGMYLGNGWCDIKVYRINMATIHEDQKDLFIKYVNKYLRDDDINGYKKANSYHDFEGHRSYHGKVTMDIQRATKEEMITQFGHGANNKRIPENLLETSREFRIGILSGLLDTDGSISHRSIIKKGKLQQNKSVMYATQSWQLAKDVQNLCLSLSICASMTTVYRKGRHEFTVIMGSEDVYAIRDELCMVSEKKKRLEEFTFGTGITSKDILPLPIQVCNKIWDSYENKKDIPGLLFRAKSCGFITRSSFHKYVKGEAKQLWKQLFDINGRYDIVIYSRKYDDPGYQLTDYQEISLIEEAKKHVKKAS